MTNVHTWGSRQDGMGVFGDTLRQARAQKGVTLKEAEQATRINRHHLGALEDENFAVLPPLIYQRGILRNYAAYLVLDPGKLLAMFEEARGGSAPVEVVAAMRPLDMPSHWAPNFAIIAFMVVMSAIVFAWIYSSVLNQATANATQVPPYPTVTQIPSPTLDDPLLLPIVVTPPTVEPATATARVIESLAAPTVSRTSPKPTAAPSPTSTPPATAVPTAPSMPTEVAGGSATETTVDTEISGQTAPTGMATIRVIAQGDIELTIVADGETVFSGWVGAGMVTEWYSGSVFQVTTSNGAFTLFENADHPDWDPFLMGEGLNETYTLTPQ